MHNPLIAALYRYPVKGLSPEQLTSASLEAGRHFPCDRLYAIENGPSGYDPQTPAFRPKTRFLMLMKHERLARLRTRYDEPSRELVIDLDGAQALRANLGDPEGRRALEAFMADYCKDALEGPPRVLTATGDFRFADSSRSGFVSLLNLASIRDLSRAAEAELDPLRFRANIHMVDLEPWCETSWVGQTITVGEARLKILKTIDRCPATHVDPSTGRRDVDVMDVLKRTYGHIECGIYAKVLTAGSIKPGDQIRVDA